MMNSKLTTWHDTADKSDEPSTPEVPCRIFKFEYSKPQLKPKKGRSLSSFIEELESDPEKSLSIKEARVWVGEQFSAECNGETLRALRLKKGLSQAQLAAKMQTSQPHIARIEKGRDSVTLDTLCKLSESLECDYNTLVSAIKLQEKIISGEKQK